MHQSAGFVTKQNPFLNVSEILGASDDSDLNQDMEGHWQVVQNKKDRKWDKKEKDLRDSCNMQSSMQGMQNLRRNKVLTKGRVCELGKQAGLSKALGPKVKFVPKWINFVFSSGQPNDVIKGVFGCDFFGKKIIFLLKNQFSSIWIIF